MCLINRGEAVGSLDEKCLFQAHFKVAVASPNGAGNILPYPSVSAESPDQEERSLALLYRKYETFGVGHGCAADWEVDPVENRAILVSAETLPEFETPSITPHVRRNDGTLVEVPMAALAGLVPDDDGFAALSEVVDLYERWVGEREQEISELLESHKTSASQHLEECRRCVTRMRLGLEYLMKDEKARKAFMLSNHAVLLQQICTQGEVRTASYDGRQQRIAFSEGYRDPSGLEPPPGRGSWRAFQVAFLLMAAQSAADGKRSGPRYSRTDLVPYRWGQDGGVFGVGSVLHLHEEACRSGRYRGSSIDALYPPALDCPAVPACFWFDMRDGVLTAQEPAGIRQQLVLYRNMVGWHHQPESQAGRNSKLGSSQHKP